MSRTLRVQDYHFVHEQNRTQSNRREQPARNTLPDVDAEFFSRPPCPPARRPGTPNINLWFVKDAGQNKRLQLLEGAIWGGSREVVGQHSGSETALPDEAAAPAAAEEEEESLELVEHSGDGDELGAGEEEEEEEGDAADAADAAGAAPRKAPKMKTVAKAVLMFGGMGLCPKVDTLQSQVCVCCDFERKQNTAQVEGSSTAELARANCCAPFPPTGTTSLLFQYKLRRHLSSLVLPEHAAHLCVDPHPIAPPHSPLPRDEDFQSIVENGWQSW